ncbi:MAG: FecR domain-containing protein [Candidatus Polarisedimenticolaceae bacterium]|nr:FecR domain-containing protein [Candidatus Polarisedimenticolaceae bacterium]
MHSTPPCKGRKHWLLSCIAAIALIALHSALAQAGKKNCDNPVAHLVSVEGVIESRSSDGGGWYPLALNAPICTNDIIRTGPNSRGGVLVEGSDTMLRLDQTTTFQIVTQPQEKERTLIELFSGIMHFISRVRHSLEVRTPYVNAAIEGTEFTVMVASDESSVVLVEGTILASNDAGSLRMEGEQAITAKKGQAPQFNSRIQPEDAVQWTLHYQPILHGLIDPAQVAAQDPIESIFRAALAALRRNDTASAFASLRHIPPTGRTPRFHNYRAALFLLVGRVEEAQRELERSLQLRADHNSAALALQAMIAVAQNKKAEALALANRAVAADQNSAAPLIALSYAQQTRFDLHGALDSINRAVLREPDNPYAHARQSELRLSYGDLDGADIAAQRAVVLNPEIELTQTVLGFARLTQLDLEQAKAHFTKAIILSSSSPMPHLGMGLLLIRQGNLEAGRRELEIATALDPRNAMVRSYMGKAYYEEHRDELAVTQYELAKKHDPQDPTPWYYHALLLQYQGRMVEALQNLQASKAKNNNRAVYRSRLMLDRDEAARSASLGQVYRDLNFEQLALLEGWRSLQSDPGDHAGHRLLADTYVYRPKHEIARVSELLQAQLLQPLSAAPIQPMLAETTLNAPDGNGPSELGFNEYSSLFYRDGTRLQVSGLVGSDDEARDEIVLSGMQGNIAYSLAQYHYESDGWRYNNDQDHKLYTAFLQANLTGRTRVQFEARRSRREYGRLETGFYAAQNNQLERNSNNQDSLRLGLYHRFNPRSELIGSVAVAEQEGGSYSYIGGNLAPPLASLSVGLEGEHDAWSVELRQLLRLDHARISLGVGYVETEEDVVVTRTLTTIPLPFVPIIATAQSTIDDTWHQANAYLYSAVDLNPDLTLDLGVSYEALSQDGFKKRRLNPKFGLLWQASPNTTLRIAGFRTLFRKLPMNQTIEPSQVAGFNQFFDGIQGTLTTRYGIAMDHRFSNRLFGGLELSRRDLDLPVRIIEPTGVQWAQSRRDEEEGRLYLYWTPTKRFSMGAEYIFERSYRDSSTTSMEDTTHRFPLSLGYYHPSGWSGSLRPTYVHQYGQFDATSEKDDSDRFWNVDLSLDYRLPKRRGRISLEVQNMLDEAFNYKENDNALLLFRGARGLTFRVSLGF